MLHKNAFLVLLLRRNIESQLSEKETQLVEVILEAMGKNVFYVIYAPNINRTHQGFTGKKARI